MSKILITMQVYENYGSPDEPYWKAKGGNDCFIENIAIPVNDEFAAKRAMMIVDGIRDKIEVRNSMYEEFIVGVDVVADDYVTEFEKFQMEYDGEIVFPTRVIKLEEFA